MTPFVAATRLPLLSRSLFQLSRVALVSLVALVLSAPTTAAPTPSEEAEKIARQIVRMIEEHHVSQREVDDTMAARLFDRFIGALDPQRRYFLEADIDEFAKQKKELDDQLRSGDVSFGFEVFERFLQRLDQRVVYAHVAIDAEHDFTVDEEVVLDRSELSWANSAAELNDIWRRSIKYELLVAMADEEFAAKEGAGEKTEDEAAKDDSEESEAVDEETSNDVSPKEMQKPTIQEDLHRKYRNFQKRLHQWDESDLLEVYLTSLTTSFDPHSTYMSRQSLENFQINMRLELDGIGAQLSSEDGYTIVRRIIPGGAAERDGRLKVEDKIVAVGQDTDGEFVDVVDMKLGDVVDQIRGKRGSLVRLKLLRKGRPGRIEIVITRDKVELEESAAQGKVFEHGNNNDGEAFKVGVIDLPSFYKDLRSSRSSGGDGRSTTRDVTKILADFRVADVDAVVIDLRRNGGGSLTEAIDMTGLFINGPVVQVKDADGDPTVYRDRTPTPVWDGPLVVLISKASASASEIFAGAIQDYRRGLVVGDVTTHGKGTVQTLEEVGRGGFFRKAEQLGALKVTRSQFYRPSGDSTQNRGVMADIVLPSWRNDAELGEANLDYALPFDRIDSSRFEVSGPVTDEIVTKLRDQSESRRSNSSRFVELIGSLEKTKALRDRTTRTLNKSAFFAEFEEEQALVELADSTEREESTVDGVPMDETPTDPTPGDGGEVAEVEEKKGIQRDFYLDEVLSITIDLLKLRPTVAAK